MTKRQTRGPCGVLRTEKPMHDRCTRGECIGFKPRQRVAMLDAIPTPDARVRRARLRCPAVKAVSAWDIYESADREALDALVACASRKLGIDTRHIGHRDRLWSGD
jgi:hypothetical protein